MGLSMYQKPELNWLGLQHTFFSLLGDISSETLRLARDPIALLGFTLMIFGIWFTIDSAREFVFGEQ